MKKVEVTFQFTVEIELTEQQVESDYFIDYAEVEACKNLRELIDSDSISENIISFKPLTDENNNSNS